MTETERADSAELLAACAARDETALRRLFEAESGRMKGIAMRILHRHDLAEEAVQDAFVQIWQNAARYDRRLGSPRAWMNAIVRFRAIDILRSRPQEDAVPPEDLDRMRDGAVEAAWTGLDGDGRLRGCLEAIDEWSRRALLLAYVAGLSQAEIAGRFSRPLGTVKSWMRRGLLSLRECLG
ncbi:sigma-70 family RNA polymerase sigma factor [Poseidonocella sp. HB161398]|uniref:sigma-70 family RNA polymerase sigma factor n=1 Tax=Poseidonocella sp. HB161398 TaxID=2320855 RepID=UPI0019818479|nr:sigma-70 family RNA polymerase sigma factor [Poseidonocella sp. HB161398]